MAYKIATQELGINSNIVNYAINVKFNTTVMPGLRSTTSPVIPPIDSNYQIKVDILFSGIEGLKQLINIERDFQTSFCQPLWHKEIASWLHVKKEILESNTDLVSLERYYNKIKGDSSLETTENAFNKKQLKFEEYANKDKYVETFQLNEGTYKLKSLRSLNGVYIEDGAFLEVTIKNREPFVVRLVGLKEPTDTEESNAQKDFVLQYLKHVISPTLIISTTKVQTTTPKKWSESDSVYAADLARTIASRVSPAYSIVRALSKDSITPSTPKKWNQDGTAYGIQNFYYYGDIYSGNVGTDVTLSEYVILKMRAKFGHYNITIPSGQNIINPNDKLDFLHKTLIKNILEVPIFDDRKNYDKLIKVIEAWDMEGAGVSSLKEIEDLINIAKAEAINTAMSLIKDDRIPVVLQRIDFTFDPNKQFHIMASFEFEPFNHKIFSDDFQFVTGTVGENNHIIWSQTDHPEKSTLYNFYKDRLFKDQKIEIEDTKALAFNFYSVPTSMREFTDRIVDSLTQQQIGTEEDLQKIVRKGNYKNIFNIDKTNTVIKELTLNKIYDHPKIKIEGQDFASHQEIGGTYWKLRFVFETVDSSFANNFQLMMQHLTSRNKQSTIEIALENLEIDNDIVNSFDITHVAPTTYTVIHKESSSKETVYLITCEFVECRLAKDPSLKLIIDENIRTLGQERYNKILKDTSTSLIGALYDRVSESISGWVNYRFSENTEKFRNAGLYNKQYVNSTIQPLVVKDLLAYLGPLLYYYFDYTLPSFSHYGYNSRNQTELKEEAYDNVFRSGSLVSQIYEDKNSFYYRNPNLKGLIATDIFALGQYRDELFTLLGVGNAEKQPITLFIDFVDHYEKITKYVNSTDIPDNIFHVITILKTLCSTLSNKYNSLASYFPPYIFRGKEYMIEPHDLMFANTALTEDYTKSADIYPDKALPSYYEFFKEHATYAVSSDIKDIKSINKDDFTIKSSNLSILDGGWLSEPTRYLYVRSVDSVIEGGLLCTLYNEDTAQLYNQVLINIPGFEISDITTANLTENRDILTAYLNHFSFSYYGVTQTGALIPLHVFVNKVNILEFYNQASGFVSFLQYEVTQKDKDFKNKSFKVFPSREYLSTDSAFEFFNVCWGNPHVPIKSIKTFASNQSNNYNRGEYLRTVTQAAVHYSTEGYAYGAISPCLYSPEIVQNEFPFITVVNETLLDSDVLYFEDLIVNNSTRKLYDTLHYYALELNSISGYSTLVRKSKKLNINLNEKLNTYLVKDSIPLIEYKTLLEDYNKVVESYNLPTYTYYGKMPPFNKNWLSYAKTNKSFMDPGFLFVHPEIYNGANSSYKQLLFKLINDSNDISPADEDRGIYDSFNIRKIEARNNNLTGTSKENDDVLGEGIKATVDKDTPTYNENKKLKTGSLVVAENVKSGLAMPLPNSGNFRESKSEIKYYDDAYLKNYTNGTASTATNIQLTDIHRLPLDRYTMNAAYPTAVLWFVEEDSEQYYMFDDLYQYTAIQSIVITRNVENRSVATVTLSNIGGLLTQDRFIFINDAIKDNFTETFTKKSSVTGFDSDSTVESFINNNDFGTLEAFQSKIKVSVGTKVVIKLGYRSDENLLNTTFIGRISQVNGGHQLNLIIDEIGLELQKPTTGSWGSFSMQNISNDMLKETRDFSRPLGINIGLTKEQANLLYDPFQYWISGKTAESSPLALLLNGTAGLGSYLTFLPISLGYRAFGYKVPLSRGAMIAQLFANYNKKVGGIEANDASINIKDITKPWVYGFNWLSPDMNWTSNGESISQNLLQLSKTHYNFRALTRYLDNGGTVFLGAPSDTYIYTRRIPSEVLALHLNTSDADSILKRKAEEYRVGTSRDLYIFYLGLARVDSSELTRSEAGDYFKSISTLLNSSPKELEKAIFAFAPNGKNYFENLSINAIESSRDFDDLADFLDYKKTGTVSIYEDFSNVNTITTKFPLFPLLKLYIGYSSVTYGNITDMTRETRIHLSPKEFQSIIDYINYKTNKNYSGVEVKTNTYDQQLQLNVKPVRRYHYVNSSTDIIKNGIVASSMEMSNTIRICDDPDDFEDSDAFEVTLSQDIPQQLRSTKNILEKRFSPGWWSSIREIFTDQSNYPMWWIAINSLAHEVAKMYRGELVLRGFPEMEPGDIIYLNDTYNEMTGAIEIETVTHYYTKEQGFVTSVVPRLVTSTVDSLDLSRNLLAASGLMGLTTLSVVAGGVMTYCGGTLGAAGGGTLISAMLIANKLNGWGYLPNFTGQGNFSESLRNPIMIYPLRLKGDLFVAGIDGFERNGYWDTVKNTFARRVDGLLKPFFKVPYLIKQIKRETLKARIQNKIGGN